MQEKPAAKPNLTKACDRMKKRIVLVLFLLWMLSYAGCALQGQPSHSTTAAQRNEALSAPADGRAPESELPEPVNAIPDFSYTEDRAIYAEGEPGVKTSNFKNTTKVDIDFNNAAKIAKNECTIQWDCCTIYLDPAECIWKVVFFTEGMLGGDQSVYLDSDGKTVLIVYGE